MSKILVVDDDPDILLTLESTLESAGHEVVKCPDPQAALSLLSASDFDAVTLDISMPQVSGYDILGNLRREAETETLPVLMLSALDNRNDRVRGLREGADDYLAKPFDPEELLLRLERMISRRPRPATQADSGLTGDLSSYPCWELLQSLERSGHSGRLSVEIPAGISRIDFIKGSPVSATFRALRGQEAILGVLSLTEGRFRVENGFSTAAPRSSEPLLGLQSLLMHFSWLQDEQTRLARFLSSQDASLRLAGQPPTPAPDSWAKLPWALVVEKVRARPGIVHSALVEDLAATRLSIDVAIGRLLEAQVLEAVAKTLPLEVAPKTAPPEDTEPSPSLRRALAPLFYQARERGEGEAQLHVLFLAESDAWEELCAFASDTFSKGVPDLPKQADWETLGHRLRQRLGASLSLDHDLGTAYFHFLVLKEETVQKARNILSSCTGVALWLGHRRALESTLDVLAKLDQSPQARRLIVAPTARALLRAQAMMTTNGPWRVLSQPPQSFATLLELLE